MDTPPLIAPPSLHARLLGPVQIAACGAPIPERAWTRRAARSLLLLLLVTPGHRLARDQVLETLWPEARPPSADSALRKVVHALRRVLEPELRAGRASRFLAVGADAIALRGHLDLWLDIEAFEQELAQARSSSHDHQRQQLRQALALYRADLLPDDPYAEWAEPRRQHLRELRRRAVLDLAAMDLQAGEPVASVPHLEPLVQAEPTDEVVLRTLMGTLARAGQRDDALRWYRQAVDRLRAELDTEPDEATHQLANEIAALVPPSTGLFTSNLDIDIQGSIPAPPNAFVGRIRELERVQDLLLVPDVRLVTITGPGGVGKTRLAQEVARQAQAEFADGVCYVALATVTDPSQAMLAIARALGLAETSTQSPHEMIHGALRDRELLLVLDNLEQIIEVACELATLLEACAKLKILATSRAPLRLRAEHRFTTPPLPVPSSDYRGGLALRNDAVTLFAERARAACPEFTLTDENVATVATISVRLDGLPLAIELAAAHSHSLSPEAILERLEDRFALLSEGYRDLPARHQTMREAIAWSYDLLSLPQQALFCRLAVFAGGWSLAAAERVCTTTRGLQAGVQEELEALADRSLVVRQGGDGGPRYGMLETIREFGLERLVATGEGDALRRAHAVYYCSLAEQAEPELRGMQQADWFDLLEDEHDNMRAALTRALDGKEFNVALRIGAALTPFWIARGYFLEGRQWLTRALQDDNAPNHLRAAALSAAGSLAEHQNDYVPAAALHEAALVAWRGLGDRSRVAATLGSLGNVAHDQGNYDRALEFHEQALAGYREIDDQWGVARALNNLGVVAYYQGDYPEAERFWNDCLPSMRALGDTRSECQVLNNLGALAFQQGDVSLAATLHEQTLALRRRLGDKQGIASSLINLGEVAHLSGTLERAAQLLEEGARVMREIGDDRQAAIALVGLSHVLRKREDIAGAVAATQESLRLFSANGDRFGLGGAMEAAASLLLLQGMGESATRLFAAAAALWEAIGAAREQSMQPDYDRAVGAAQKTLGDTAFDAAWRAGRRLSLERAVTEAMNALGGERP